MTGGVLGSRALRCDVEISTLNRRFTFAFARKILFFVSPRAFWLPLHTACTIEVRPIKSIWDLCKFETFMDLGWVPFRICSNTLLYCTENEHMPLCHRNLSSRSLGEIQLMAS